MPELPEVETVVRTLRPHAVDRRCAALELPDPSCLEKASLPLDRAAGALVRAVDRRGKFIVMRLDAADGARLHLAVHLRMTGRLTAWEDGAGPGPDVAKHVRLVIRLEGGKGPCRLVFSDARRFGRVFLGTDEGLAAWPSWRKLGPEPLEMTGEAFCAAVRGRRAVKSVLLDQTVLAGIGNIYADESLHAAGIRPDMAADALPEAAKRRLLVEIRRLLLLSIQECGSSIRDYQDADGNVGAFQNHFHVYGRAGEPCLDCGTKLKRVVVSGRGTVFCPRCQKRRWTAP